MNSAAYMEREQYYAAHSRDLGKEQIQRNIAKGDMLTAALSHVIETKYNEKNDINVARRTRRGRFAGDIDIRIRKKKHEVIVEVKNWDCGRYVHAKRDILTRVSRYVRKRNRKVLVVLAGAKISAKTLRTLQRMGITVLVYERAFHISDEDAMQYAAQIAHDMMRSVYEYRYGDAEMSFLVMQRKMFQIMSDEFGTVDGENIVWGLIDPGGGFVSLNPKRKSSGKRRLHAIDFNDNPNRRRGRDAATVSKREPWEVYYQKHKGSKKDKMSEHSRSDKETEQEGRLDILDVVRRVSDRKRFGDDKAYDFRDIVPKAWKRVKKQYVAVLDIEDGEVKRNFIGTLTGFSRSGANADLIIDDSEIPTELGSLIEVRSGSHKHLSQKIYRLDKDGWRLVAERDGTSAVYGWKKKDWELLKREK